MKKTETFVSIIIPVRIITKYLEESLGYLKELDYSNFEVIVFTDFEKSYKSRLPRNFRIIPTGAIGPAEKRNLSLKFAKGEILAFLDDDAYPKKDWLKKAVPNFSQKRICAVGGPGVTPTNEKFLEKASGEVLASFLASGGTTERHKPGDKKFVDDYPTVNLLVRTSDFKKVKGFDTAFWPGEDTKLCLDLIDITGKKILYDPEVIVFHHRRSLFRPHLKQISRYGMHRGQFAKIFPKTSRKLAYFIPSLFVLGLILGPLSYFISTQLFLLYLFILYAYLLLIALEAFRVVYDTKDIRLFFYFPLGVFLTHIFYGTNFLYGLLKKPKLNLKNVDSNKRVYVGG